MCQRRGMPISRSTRIHFIYQFIILALLFLSIGYHELLPDRKFILFLAFIPMFCYQFVILSYCTGLLPVPSWMNIVEDPSETQFGTEKNAQQSIGDQEVPDTQTSKKRTTLIEYDNISNGCDFEPNPYILMNWKTELDNIEIPSAFPDATHAEQFRTFRTHQHSLPRSRTFQTLDLESDFSKSYSFPFRQKKLEKWRKSKENLPKQSNSFLNIPCQTSEYTADTHQEARRFNVTVSKAEVAKNMVDELNGQTEMPNLTPLAESDGSNSTLDIKNLPFKPYTSKFPLGHMNKLKAEISNRFSRSKKREKTENEHLDYKVGKRTPISPKIRLRSTENISSEPRHQKGIRFYVRQKLGNKKRINNIYQDSELFQTENFEINRQKPAFRWYNENK